MKYWIIVCLVISVSCAPTRLITPLDKGEKAIGANFGGPLIILGDVKLPVPFTSIYGAYGLKDNLSVFGGLHTTSLAFNTIQVDLGINQNLLNQAKFRPGLSYNASLNALLGIRDYEFRGFPALDLNAYWNYGRNMSYIGSSAWMDFYKTAAPNPDQHNYLIPTFNFGQQLQIKKWSIGFEYKALFPWKSNEEIVVNYATFGNTGANGIYFNLIRKF